MNKKTNPIENIKIEAKKYYKGKNMIPRYIVIGFLFILIALQFVLPKQKLDLADTVKDDPEIIEESHDDYFNFLGKDIYLSQKDVFFQDKFEYSLAQMTDQSHTIQYLANTKSKVLSYLDAELAKNNIPKDFKYLTMIDKGTIFPLSLEIEKYFGLQIDQDIDERLDYKKMTSLLVQYLGSLYKDFKDWNLVLIGYIVGAENLKSLMLDQNQVDLDKMYLTEDISKIYFDILAYKHIFENLEIEPVTQLKVKSIKLGETKDLLKWAQKNGYNYKEIKELNPWILGNSIPKGKRELEIIEK